MFHQRDLLIRIADEKDIAGDYLCGPRTVPAYCDLYDPLASIMLIMDTSDALGFIR